MQLLVILPKLSPHHKSTPLGKPFINNHARKITEQGTGEGMGEMFHEMGYGDEMQMHKCNIFRQYSKLKFFKKFFESR